MKRQKLWGGEYDTDNLEAVLTELDREKRQSSGSDFSMSFRHTV